LSCSVIIRVSKDSAAAFASHESYYDFFIYCQEFSVRIAPGIQVSIISLVLVPMVLRPPFKRQLRTPFPRKLGPCRP
jgi:hypothetical protein